MLVKILER